METNSGSGEFKIPLISTHELEAKSVAYNSQEDENEDETSLPALTNELIEAQYSQCAKIAEGQKNLSALKEKIKEGNQGNITDLYSMYLSEEEEQTRITADVHSIVKLICLAQDDAASAEAECCSSKNEILGLIKENALLQSTLSDHEVQLESNRRLYAKYCRKMDSHSLKVKDIEQSHELYQQVAILRDNISKTNDQKMIQFMESGNTCISDEVKKLQEKIFTLEASKDSEVINQVECCDLEMTNNSTIQQLQQDIALMKKRQQAQVTRMQRQLQSLRHSSEKCRKLQSEIQQLKMKMDQEYY